MWQSFEGPQTFQSTLSQGERPTGEFTTTGLGTFQSTLSQGERLGTAKAQADIDKAFQSTLSQGERPCKPPQYYDGLLISIHALARRATKIDSDIEKNAHISIHALARRATITMPCSVNDLLISIHALARRATTMLNRVYH